MANCKANREKLINLMRICKYNLLHDDFDVGFAELTDSRKCKDEAELFGQYCALEFGKIAAQQKLLAKQAIERIFTLAQKQQLTEDCLCINDADVGNDDDDKDDDIGNDDDKNDDDAAEVLLDMKVEPFLQETEIVSVAENIQNSHNDRPHKHSQLPLVDDVAKSQSAASSCGTKRQLKTYSCKICNKYFFSAAKLRQHSVNAHNEDRAFVCEYCNAKFTLIANLDEHVRRHLGIKRHLCSYCGKAFTNATQLKVHVRVHTKEKPYSCLVCNKKFNASGQLRRHEKTHTLDRPYACEICARCFALRKTLKQHLLVHSKSKPYQCEYCNTSFSQSPNFYKHRKKCRLQQRS